MWYILSVLALVILTITFIIDSVFIMIYNVKDKKWFKLTQERNKRRAILIDVFGNYLFRDLWNRLFSEKGYQFGVLGETLSSCFGKKRKEKSLTKLGFVISKVIDLIDFTTWKKGGHCISSIQTNDEIKNMFNN